jgi:hypothetical protein
MKKNLQWGSGLATLFLIVSSIQANAPAPVFLRRDARMDPRNYSPAPANPPVHIETSADGPQVRLVIPKKLLAQMPAGTAIQGPADNLFARWNKVLPLAAGLALGLILVPIVLGKVKGRRLAAAIGLLLALTATYFPSQTSRAHPPIGLPPPIPPFKLTGQVTVEVVEEGDAIRLIFNKNQGITTQYGN